FPFYVHIMIL
ncbi:putative membrane protein, partial [Chlamydia psittaci 08-2626_L3]